MNDKYNDFKDEDAQFDLDEYAKSIFQDSEPLRIPCYVIPHLWGKDDICLHCGFARKELYGDKAVEHVNAADEFCGVCQQRHPQNGKCHARNIFA